MKRVCLLGVAVLFLSIGFACAEGKPVKGITIGGTAYETGVLGKGIIIGRIISKEEAKVQSDDQSGYLILKNSYYRFPQEPGEGLPAWVKVYKKKDGMVTDNTSAWQRASLPSRLKCPIEKFDKDAAYYADYEVWNYLSYSLKELSASAKEGTVEFFCKLGWECPNKPCLFPTFFNLLGGPHAAGAGDGMGVGLTRGGETGPLIVLIEEQPTLHAYKTKLDMAPLDASTLKKGEWHHYAVTWDGSQCNFYLDGTKLSSGKVAVNGAWEELVVGSSKDNWPNFGGMRIFGTIDEFRLSNIARSSDEIAGDASASEELKCDKNTVILCHFEDTADGISGLENK